MAFAIKSTAFAPNGRMEPKHTCDGDDVSPPLSWSGAPRGTRGFALVCTDPDAPSGTWHHWAVYDIPAETTGLPEDYAAEAAGGPKQAVNDFYRRGYGGPCPPCGHGTHHYHFRLYALDIDRLPLQAPAHSRDVERAAKLHRLAETEVIGTYERR